MPRVTIASTRAFYASELAELRKQASNQAETIASQRGEIASRDERIDTLLQANNHYQQQARDARAECARLQESLTDASRVIATLGRRGASVVMTATDGERR